MTKKISHTETGRISAGAPQKPTAKKQLVKPQPASVADVADVAESVGAIRPLVDRFKNVKLPNGATLKVPAPVAFVDVESLDVLSSSAIANLAVVTLNARCPNALDRIADTLVWSASKNLRDSARPQQAVAESYTDDKDCCASEALCDDSEMFNVRRCRLHLGEQLTRMGSSVYPDTQRFWQNQSGAAFGALVNQPEHSVADVMLTVLGVLRNCLQTAYIAAIHDAHSLMADSVYGVDPKTEFLIKEAVASNFMLFARGPQFDVAALERMMFMTLGIRPSKTPLGAFDNDVGLPSNGFYDRANEGLRGRYAASWYYRAPKDVRTFLEGFELGLCAVMDSAEDVRTCMDTLYKRARASSAEVVNRAVQRAGTDCLSNTELATMFRGDKSGAHIAELDVFYDMSLVLPILNGSSVHVVEQVVEAD